MSDKTNNLNENSENIQFDEQIQDYSSEPNKQGTVNKATAPLPELPDTEDGHVADTMKSESSAPKVEKETSVSSEEVVKAIAPLPELPDTEDGHVVDTMKSESSAPMVEKETIATSEETVNKATAPLPELPDTEDEHLAETIESESSAVEAKSSESSVSSEDNNKVDDVKPVEPVKPVQIIKPLKPKQTEESDKPQPLVQFTKLEESDKSDLPSSSEAPEKSPAPSDNIKFTSTDKKDGEHATIHSRRSIFGDKNDEQSFLTFKTRKDDPTPLKNPDTAVLSEKSAVWRKVIDSQAQGTTSSLGEQREVLFVIRGMIERVVMKDNSTVTLGRFDTGTVPNEEIDLIPYGAIDRGVSRRHCKIQLQGNHLHVIDLQSTNGTFLAGVRLNPNEATVLRKGDELLLGRLAVQVLFR